MSIILGFFILILFYLLGTVLSKTTGEFIPGSVIGMILLLLSLQLKLVKPKYIKTVAINLTQNMALFFVPVGVGIMAATNVVFDYLPEILIASSLSTILILISVAYSQQQIERWKR